MSYGWENDGCCMCASLCTCIEGCYRWSFSEGQWVFHISFKQYLLYHDSPCSRSTVNGCQLSPHNSTSNTQHHTTPLHTTPQNSTPLHTTPHNSTPLRTTPHNSTSLHTTPHHSTPLHTTPTIGAVTYMLYPLCQLNYYVVTFLISLYFKDWSTSCLIFLRVVFVPPLIYLLYV